VNDAGFGLELAYLEFKLARSLYHKSVAVLTAEERREVRRVAVRQREIEARVLGTTDAVGVCVPPQTVDSAVHEIRQRYGDEAEFAADLAANGLSQAALEAALGRELAVEAVLEKVSAHAPAVSDTDAELFYRLHLDRFWRPERRRASHILVTINDLFEENRREAARARAEAIAARLAREAARFAEQAMKHSECPTALHGGMLGEYRRGRLFPALDVALFALREGELSGVVESPLGFHILRCDAILASGTIAFGEARERIRAMLADHRARSIQRDWLRQQASASPDPGSSVRCNRTDA
jgi:peptidyl-prolyl cis-trans isomerase C